MMNSFSHFSLAHQLIQTITHYSLRKLSTGLATAAFIAWKLTVSNAINKAETPASTNIHQLIFIRYAKLCSHLFIDQYDKGNAMMHAIKTSFINSLESILVTCGTDAPSTFRMPISLVRFSAVYVAKPNNPRQATNMVSIAKMLRIVPVFCSAE